MSAQDQIARLQGLLARIQKNAGQLRVAYAGNAPAAERSASPTTRASNADLDGSVDDLLGVSPGPSVAPEAEPIPLVALSAHSRAAETAAPPADADFGLESEVSEVRSAMVGLREPAIEVTVAAIEAEADATIGPEELSEDDMVEIGDAESVAPPAASGRGNEVDIDFDDEVDQPPASSKRSKVASSMDEALAAAAEQLESEREVPLHTPPPESGPQQAMPPMPAGIAAPRAPDVDSLLGEELIIPTRAAGPTTEQLGQTIDLEEARGPSLELAEQQAAQEVARGAGVEELEVALPARDVVGGYDARLEPPPEAREELAAHRRRLEDDALPPPESLAQLPSVQPGPPQEPDARATSADTGPEAVARPVPVGGSAESFVSTRESFRPKSFTELLDASLGLNGD